MAKTERKQITRRGRRKATRLGRRRRVHNAGLSLRHVKEAISEMEARYRAYRPTRRQRPHYEAALRLLAAIKRRIHVFCLRKGAHRDLINIKNGLAVPE